MIKKAVYRSSGRRIRTVGRRCRVRLCCMTALRCILYGRCMSHDRCTFHVVGQVYAAMQGGLMLPDATYDSSADHSAVLDEYGIRIQQLCMLARMRAAAANSTAHDAIAVETTMARLLRSDAYQSQLLPKCVDRSMAWVRKGCYRR